MPRTARESPPLPRRFPPRTATPGRRRSAQPRTACIPYRPPATSPTSSPRTRGDPRSGPPAREPPTRRRFRARAPTPPPRAAPCAARVAAAARRVRAPRTRRTRRSTCRSTRSPPACPSRRRPAEPSTLLSDPSIRFCLSSCVGVRGGRSGHRPSRRRSGRCGCLQTSRGSYPAASSPARRRSCRAMANLQSPSRAWTFACAPL